MRGSFRGCTTDWGSPCAISDLGLVAYSCIASSVISTCGTRPSLYLLPVILVWIYIDHLEEMITLIGRRSMLLMWRYGISGDSILGMTFFYQLRIYHHHEMITLDGIGISRESISAIQHVVILGHLETSQLGSIDG
ncbi:hypothetical protein M9H77_08162 [Catharanthus roseus]|uniref:Uncharacterized protein n=1 Tax=Catharanthus roseus TaxID=4058 RepID=A0ACC0BWX3_CATRO|nr:hypothetical protein M9H77_08162 [Catharanthus roseus]